MIANCQANTPASGTVLFASIIAPTLKVLIAVRFAFGNASFELVLFASRRTGHAALVAWTGLASTAKVGTMSKAITTSNALLSIKTNGLRFLSLYCEDREYNPGWTGVLR